MAKRQRQQNKQFPSPVVDVGRPEAATAPVGVYGAINRAVDQCERPCVVDALTAPLSATILSHKRKLESHSPRVEDAAAIEAGLYIVVVDTGAYDISSTKVVDAATKTCCSVRRVAVHSAV